MSNIVTASGRSINTVTAEIVAISNQAAQMAYMSMIEIGKRLVEAKSMVDHGEWGAYLKNEVKFSQRTANNFMQIYERSLSEANSQTFANLGYSQIVKLLALPDEEVAELAKDHDLQDMSVRQLEQAIRERDAARKEKAEADAQVKELRAAQKNAESDAAAAKAALKSAKDREQAAQAALKKAQQEPEIPEATIAQLRADAEAEVARRMTEEYQKKLEAAEAAAREAGAKLEAAQKSGRLSNQDLMSINVLGKQILTTWNSIQGHKLKAVAANPSSRDSINAFLKKVLETMQKGIDDPA